MTGGADESQQDETAGERYERQESWTGAADAYSVAIRLLDIVAEEV